MKPPHTNPHVLVTSHVMPVADAADKRTAAEKFEELSAMIGILLLQNGHIGMTITKPDGDGNVKLIASFNWSDDKPERLPRTTRAPQATASRIVLPN